MRAIKLLFTASTLALASSTALAVEVYAGAGTTGFLIGIEHAFDDNLAVRADLDTLSMSRTASDSSANYSGTLKTSSLALLGDYRPWGGRFRLTGGVLIGNTQLTGQADGNSTGAFNIDGILVSDMGQTLAAQISFPSVRPYLGIGVGHANNNSGFTFNGDLGVAYGRPTVTLTATPGLVMAATAQGTSIAAEQARLQSKVDPYRFYPVARIGVGYAF